MIKKILKKLVLIAFIAVLGVYQMNAQEDISYTFDSNWDGFTGGNSAPWQSTLFWLAGTAPNTGIVRVTYDADTKNAVMYNGTNINADVYKFVRITLRNESSQCNLLRIRAKIDGTTWKQQDLTITTNDAGFKTYEFELANTAAWNGTDLINQVVFRKSDNTVITDGGTIYVDQIVYSTASTAGVDDVNQKDDVSIAVYPNPAQTVLQVNASSIIEKMEVYNLLGQLIIVNENSDKIALSALLRGKYIVKIFQENGTISTKRFVKE